MLVVVRLLLKSLLDELLFALFCRTAELLLACLDLSGEGGTLRRLLLSLDSFLLLFFEKLIFLINFLLLLGLFKIELLGLLLVVVFSSVGLFCCFIL